MAEILFAFDTVKKSLVVTLDGSPVTDVADVAFYRCGRDEYHMDIVQRTENEDMDTVTYTRTMATEQAVAALASQTKTDPSLERQAVIQAIAELFLKPTTE